MPPIRRVDSRGRAAAIRPRRPISSVLIAVGALGLLAAVPPATTSAPAPASAGDDSAVYTALLRERFGQSVFREPLLIDRQTTRLPRVPRKAEQSAAYAGAHGLPALKRETIRAYLARNRESRVLPASVAPGFAYAWTHGGVRPAGYGSRDPDPICPGMIVDLSSVGYDRRHAQALVHVNYENGRCSYAEWVLLERNAGTWKVAGRSTESMT